MEERPRVLFVLPPGGVTPYFAEHLGTAFLRAVLARAGVASEQYLPAPSPSLREFAGFLRERRPAFVGLTAYESNLRACRALVRAAREAVPDAVVAVGGPNATFSPEETIGLLGADLCFRGAGEGTIGAIVQAILGADRPRMRLAELLAGIPSLVLRTAEGLHRTRTGELSSFPAERFATLDDIPSPYQDGILATPDVGLLTARGCNQHCTYCSFGTISGRRVHFHGVERVLEDVAALKALAARAGREGARVSIYDDAFSLSPGRARAICEGIVARGLQMPFECVTRADRVDAELLRLMRSAGFAAVSFGLESAVPRVLRAAGKVRAPTTGRDPGLGAERAFLDRLRAAVSAAKAAGLATSVSIIAGLPGEAADDLRATLAFVESLGVERYVHNELTLFPGTPLYRDRARHGLSAARDEGSGAWRTTHAYDVRSVPPLRTSSIHEERWEEAHEISDALCGRPRPERGGEGAAWAVVLHGGAPDAERTAWLARVLTVHGAVVVVSDGPGVEERSAWVRALDAAGVPFGRLALLVRDGAAGGGRAVLRTLGTLGEHRFVIEPEWRPRGARMDAAGHLRVPVWIASESSRAPPAARAPFPSTAEIADGCRFWSGWRRCRHPRVLHVDAEATVRPCWAGPAIGRVGDAYALLVRRARSLAPSSRAPGADRCPIASPPLACADAVCSTETYEVAAQTSWLFRLDRAAADPRPRT